MRKCLLALVGFGLVPALFAGNPDRQGEAGFGQLLLVPYAQTAGVHALNTAHVSGVDAFGSNIAGLGNIDRMELNLGQTIYLSGTDVNIFHLGFATKLKKGGAFGVSLVNVDVGDIRRTSVNNPEGDGTTFSPSLFSLNIGYAKTFEDKISVGLAVKVVSESIEDIKMSTVAFDAGVQYRTGGANDDRFRFGVALRNVGAPASFTGDGLITNTPISFEGGEFLESTVQRGSKVEVQSSIKIGASFGVVEGDINKLMVMANFTSNAYSRDVIGAGLEYGFKNLFAVRGGYIYEVDQIEGEESIYSGLAAGASVQLPLGKADNASILSLDYAYRTTRRFDGTHNIGLRLNLR